jgi:transcriptional regulator with XRE-family HTH domain
MKHPLGKYLSSRKESQNAFAKRSGLHVSVINRVIRGERPPSVAFAKRVAKVTKNAVKWTALFDWRKAAQ